jgi:hypothetical protein
MFDPPILDVKPHNEITYNGCMKKAVEALEAGADPRAVLGLQAWAYTRPSGFYHFCKDVVGLSKLSPVFHDPILKHATGYLDDRFHRRRLTLAFRGSYKSSICSIAYPAWKIAKDTIENAGVCNISIVIASERKALAKSFVKSVRGVLQKPRYQELFGTHKPSDRGDSWSNLELTSRLKDADYKKDPTVFIMALGAEQTGYHADVAVADDLQAYASSYSPDQLENCWELYTLLLNAVLSPDGEMLVAGTHWSYMDIYSRIIEANKAAADSSKFAITKLPILLPNGMPAFPEEFPMATVLEKQSGSTSFVWATQFMLDPLPDEKRRFSLSDLRYRDPETDKSLERKKLFAVMGVDPAWVSSDRIRSGEANAEAYSVVVTLLIDSSYNLYLVECFRDRPNRHELSAEIWRQWERHHPTSIGMQQYDYKFMAEEFDRMSLLKGTMPRFDWLSSTGNERKQDRIEGALDGFVRAHKLYIYRNLTWLEDEFVSFPYSKTLDGLDAIVNAVKVAAVPVVKEDTSERPKKLDADRIIDAVESGRRRRGLTWKRAY